MEQQRAILIDGKNSVYRAIFAGRSDEKFRQSGWHPSVIVARFVRSYLDKFNPDSVHIFWDAPKSTLWRKAIYEEYKEDREEKKYDFDIGKELEQCVKICKAMFKCLGAYQYQMKEIEADDLIYAWCRYQCRKGDFTIISNDRDLTQIPYQFSNVSQYDPLRSRMITVPVADPAEVKSFMGDSSDCITGYNGIGPKRAERLAIDLVYRAKFLQKEGAEIYERNRRLVDLSLCPDLPKLIFYISGILGTRPKFDDNNLKRLASKVHGLYREYHNTLSAFKYLLKPVQT